MTVNDVYILMLNICAKNLQQGYLSPADFNSYINQGQRGYTDYLKGEYQKYQLRRPIAPVEFGQTEQIRTSLAPLIYGIELNPNTTTGIASYPSDFEYMDAMFTLYGLYDIRFIQQDRQRNYISSVIDPIEENPVYLLEERGFHFYPQNIGFAYMSYLRTPPPITWGYDEDENEQPVYNAAKSQQPVWADTDMIQIIVRALQFAGVQMQIGSVLQYAQQVKEGGQ